MAENPLKIIEKLDLGLFRNVETTQTLALADGALPRKVKLLMAMALDASHGTVQGVKSLTQQAMKAGATKEEIMEVLKVCVAQGVQACNLGVPILAGAPNG